MAANDGVREGQTPVWMLMDEVGACMPLLYPDAKSAEVAAQGHSRSGRRWVAVKAFLPASPAPEPRAAVRGERGERHDCLEWHNEGIGCTHCHAVLYPAPPAPASRRRPVSEQNQVREALVGVLMSADNLRWIALRDALRLQKCPTSDVLADALLASPASRADSRVTEMVLREFVESFLDAYGEDVVDKTIGGENLLRHWVRRWDAARGNA